MFFLAFILALTLAILRLCIHTVCVTDWVYWTHGWRLHHWFRVHWAPRMCQAQHKPQPEELHMMGQPHIHTNTKQKYERMKENQSRTYLEEPRCSWPPPCEGWTLGSVPDLVTLLPGSPSCQFCGSHVQDYKMLRNASHGSEVVKQPTWENYPGT